MANGFIDIYAIAKDHFWIAAYEEVYHYLNGTWKKYFIGEKYYVQSIEGIEGSIFLTAYPIGTDSLYLMRLNGSNFNIIDKTKIKNHKFGPNALQFTNSKIYTFGIGIISSRISGTEINLENWNIETRPTTGGFSNSLLISSKDIWAVGINSYPHHYNGSNWEGINIFKGDIPSEHFFYGIWGNGSHVFISDLENSKIYHGK